MICYFISYTTSTSYSFGSGNCEMRLSRPIRSMQDVKDVTALLRREGIDNPVVMSFTRLDAEEAEQ
jgi:hypothetical protein